MYLEENEAITKTCPQMPSMMITGSSSNKDNMLSNVHGHTHYPLCSASKCMAWRWAGGIPSSGKGYCGAFGKPGVIEK